MQAPAVFERFEVSYHEIGKSLSHKTSIVAQSRGNASQTAIDDARSDVQTMSRLLTQMDKDLMQFPFHMKTKYDPMLRRLKAAFDGQKQDLDRLISSNQKVDSYRAQLLTTRYRSDRVGESLNGMISTNEESEQIGAHVAIRLKQQREQLLSATDNVNDVDAVVHQAKTLMSRMGRRVVTDKLIQGIIILLEILIIVAIIYHKFLSF